MKSPFNIRCEDKEFAAVSVGALGGDSIASKFAVVVPIMTNAVAVKKGGGVVFRNHSQDGNEAEGRVVENRRGQGRESPGGQRESENGGQQLGSRDRDLSRSRG